MGTPVDTPVAGTGLVKPCLKSREQKGTAKIKAISLAVHHRKIKLIENISYLKVKNCRIKVFSFFYAYLWKDPRVCTLNYGSERSK